MRRRVDAVTVVSRIIISLAFPNNTTRRFGMFWNTVQVLVLAFLTVFALHLLLQLVGQRLGGVVRETFDSNGTGHTRYTANVIGGDVEAEAEAEPPTLHRQRRGKRRSGARASGARATSSWLKTGWTLSGTRQKCLRLLSKLRDISAKHFLEVPLSKQN